MNYNNNEDDLQDNDLSDSALFIIINKQKFKNINIPKSTSEMRGFVINKLDNIYDENEDNKD